MHEELAGGREETFVLQAVLIGDTFFMSDVWEGEQSAAPEEVIDKACAVLKPADKVSSSVCSSPTPEHARSRRPQP